VVTRRIRYWFGMCNGVLLDGETVRFAIVGDCLNAEPRVLRKLE
jgi:hypothetical protein